jgi:Flp pilus assembly protein TadD
VGRKSRKKSHAQKSTRDAFKADSSSQESESKTTNLNRRWAVPGVCVFLAIITFAVFGQTAHYDFVNFDDNLYVYKNPNVTLGITSSGVASVFSFRATDNWVPLTTISHMVDCQVYGLNAGEHHLTNVLLQATTAILLFLVLHRMTAALWRSAFVAAVFAVHPLRAESVAWVSERKDVLCGIFFMLTLWGYIGYARNSKSLIRYLAALFFAILALMSKPVAVTLPFVLLLLDYWPLNRFNVVTIHRLVIEKIPFLALSIGSSILTVLAEKQAIASLNVPIHLRVENALVSSVTYIKELFFPANLVALYPYPIHGLPSLEVCGAFIFLTAISLAVLYWRRKYPYLLVGWFWYLVMLAPVIGLMQVGQQAHADRHTYLSEIGLCLLLTWLTGDLSLHLRHRVWALSGMSIIILTALVLTTYVQVSYWKNSRTLWEHALSCTSNNTMAYYNLGEDLREEGNLSDAIADFRQANEFDPNNAEVHYDLGLALSEMGDVSEAITNYERALQIDPNFAEAQNNLGNALFQNGNIDDAMVHYQKALLINPDSPEALNGLAWALAINPRASQRNGYKAVELAQRANQLTRGENPGILSALAAAYAENGQFAEAVNTAQSALQLAQAQSNTALADNIRSQLKLYQAGLPYHLQ